MFKKIIHSLRNNVFLRDKLWCIITLVALYPHKALAGFTLGNPLKAANLVALLEAVVNVIIQFGVPVVAVFIVYSGFLFVTARGNQEQLTRAKKNFLWVIIGTAIVLGVKVIIMVVSNTVQLI